MRCLIWLLLPLFLYAELAALSGFPAPKENAPKAAGERTSEQQSQKALQTVAKQFGLIPQDINQAIR
jgi:hypothetical protein